MAINIGDVTLATPIMLAPMAGVTNPPFRQLCREFAEAGARSAGVELPVPGRSDGRYAPTGLWVCEMITSRALIERTPVTMTMIQPDEGDPVRSIQLYGVEPKVMAEATKILVGEGWADHIDLNFGCPVPKVTKKGGGSALPWKHDLYAALIRETVSAAEKSSGGHTVPVTAKFRIGIDDDHETFLDVARISELEGIKALTLHARTMTQHYAGKADWSRIGELKAITNLPVFGNGDIFEAEHAGVMIESTGADGVTVGRGCQGRPWLFFDLAAAANGSDERMRPNLREVADIILRHAKLSIAHFGEEDRAMRDFRKHVGWYLRGFAVGGEERRLLNLVTSFEELSGLLHRLDLEQDYPRAATGKRGRAGHPKRPHLPEFWLDSHELSVEQKTRIHEAELGVSGG